MGVNTIARWAVEGRIGVDEIGSTSGASGICRRRLAADTNEAPASSPMHPGHAFGFSKGAPH